MSEAAMQKQFYIIFTVTVSVVKSAHIKYRFGTMIHLHYKKKEARELQCLGKGDDYLYM